MNATAYKAVNVVRDLRKLIRTASPRAHLDPFIAENTSGSIPCLNSEFAGIIHALSLIRVY